MLTVSVTGPSAELLLAFDELVSWAHKWVPLLEELPGPAVKTS